jgi:DNA-binding NarL/FixJ family response regulator
VIEVGIIEDDRATREGLALLIDGTPGLRCQQTFGSAEEALRAAPAGELNVLLLDIHLPGMAGPEAIPALKERFPTAAILMLTVYEGQERVFEALCNGAVGYLLKKTAPARLLESIREASDGGSPMSPEIARQVVTAFRDLRPKPPETGLSKQQLRLLALLVEGHSYLSAGAQLGITVNTVRNHIRKLYEVLQVHSKSEAVSKALKQGIV